ncbi:SRPBCC family protein [Desulfoluna sp.]|uniref:SRPBCC family protein n=1 Tax=Desulfoluna sp. TaxID=2045199 RepID=UPI002609BE31|nr:SRPBCC family protein [Desulfoluna sp.]
MHTLTQNQLLPTTREKAWAFIQAPANLNTLTPPWLHFEIVSEIPETMENGLIIEYRIGLPLLGRQRWITEIKHIKAPCRFVDEQRLGPYRFWYHHHELTETPKGVLMTDTIHYRLPLGPIGELIHALFIRKVLTRIFAYRHRRFTELFTPYPPSEA